eukprot:967898_1
MGWSTKTNDKFKPIDHHPTDSFDASGLCIVTNYMCKNHSSKSRIHGTKSISFKYNETMHYICATQGKHIESKDDDANESLFRLHTRHNDDKPHDHNCKPHALVWMLYR